MYASDLGAAHAAPKILTPFEQAARAGSLARAAGLFKKLPVAQSLPIAPVIPVLKLPQVGPTVNPALPPPSITPVIPPITTADAAPATGGPQPYPMPVIRVTPGADEDAELTPMSAGFSPWLAVALFGAFLVLKKKGR